MAGAPFNTSGANWDPGLKKGRKSGDQAALALDQQSAVADAKSKAYLEHLYTAHLRNKGWTDGITKEAMEKFPIPKELYTSAGIIVNSEDDVRKTIRAEFEAKFGKEAVAKVLDVQPEIPKVVKDDSADSIKTKIAEIENTLRRLPSTSTLGEQLQGRLAQLQNVMKVHKADFEDEHMPAPNNELFNADDADESAVEVDSEGFEDIENEDISESEDDIEACDPEDEECVEGDSSIRDSVIDALKSVQMTLEDEVSPEDIIAELDALLADPEELTDALSDAGTEAEATEDPEIAESEEDMGLEPEGSHDEASEEFADFSDLDEDPTGANDTAMTDSMRQAFIRRQRIRQKRAQIKPESFDTSSVKDSKNPQDTTIIDKTRHTTPSKKNDPQNPSANTKTVSKSIPEHGRNGKLPVKNMPKMESHGKPDASVDTSTVSNKRPSTINSFDDKHVTGKSGPMRWSSYNAKLTKAADNKRSYWTVYGVRANKQTPIYRVYASAVYPNLDATPKPNEIAKGLTFKSYYDAFCHEGYGKTLTALSTQQGWHKTASTAKAVIANSVKRAMGMDCPPGMPTSSDPMSSGKSQAEYADGSNPMDDGESGSNFEDELAELENYLEGCEMAGDEEEAEETREEIAELKRRNGHTASSKTRVRPNRRQKAAQPEMAEDDEHEDKKPPTDTYMRQSSRQVNYQVRFIADSKNNANDQWIVYANRKPVFRVKAGQAFTGDLNARPKPNEYPRPFKSYYQAFVDSSYGNELIKYVKENSWQKAAVLVNGDVIIKRAQQNNPPLGSVPTGPGQPGGIDQQAVPENMQQDSMTTGGMNPDAETLERYDEDTDNKPAVVDAIKGVLAVLVATGSYSVEEIMQELQGTFQDTDQASSFQGALAEEAQNLSETDTNNPGASMDTGTGTAQPQNAQVQEMAQQLQSMQASNEQYRSKLKSARRVIEVLSKSASTSVRVASAQELVNEMQTRIDGNGVPLIPTAEYLASQGVPISKTAELVETRRKEEITKLAKLSDKEFEAQREMILRFPKAEQIVKSASEREFGDAMPLIYMASETDDKRGKFGLSEDMFQANPLAEKHAQDRKNHRMR